MQCVLLHDFGYAIGSLMYTILKNMVYSKIRFYVIRILTTAILLIITATSATGESHEKIFGLTGGYISKNTSGMAGIHFSYQLNPRLRISPNALYIFRHNDTDAFSLNADCQFTFQLKNDSAWTAYPLIGLGYWSWYNARRGDSENEQTIPVETTDDVSSRRQRYSLNMGAGLQWMATPTLALSFEAKYALMRHLSTAVVSMKIGYRF